jgi:hypothetical protein
MADPASSRFAPRRGHPVGEEFTCPNCGASLTLDDLMATTVRCKFCGTSVVVPESARRPAAARPIVIQLRGSGINPSILRRVGTVVVILTVVSVLVAGFLGLAGLAVGIFAVAGVPGEAELEAGGLGRQLSAFGEAGIGAGFFTDARSLGLDADGKIYVGEYQGGRIQVFESAGEFVTQWFADREFPLTGMAVGRDGTVFTVQRGELLRRDGMTGESLGAVAYEPGQHFEDVVVMPDGGLLAGWYLFQDDLVVFDRSLEWALTVPEVVSGQTGDSELSLRVAADGRGDLLALGEFNSAVFRYEPDGRFVNRFGGEGDQPGQLTAPMSIAVDGRARVYVGDIHGVQVFDLDGRFVGSVKTEGVPFGLALDPEGDLWMVNGTRVIEYAIEAP